MAKTVVYSRPVLRNATVHVFFLGLILVEVWWGKHNCALPPKGHYGLLTANPFLLDHDRRLEKDKDDRHWRTMDYLRPVSAHSRSMSGPWDGRVIRICPSSKTHRTTFHARLKVGSTHGEAAQDHVDPWDGEYRPRTLRTGSPGRQTIWKWIRPRHPPLNSKAIEWFISQCRPRWKKSQVKV